MDKLPVRLESDRWQGVQRKKPGFGGIVPGLKGSTGNLHAETKAEHFFHDRAIAEMPADEMANFALQSGFLAQFRAGVFLRAQIDLHVAAGQRPLARIGLEDPFDQEQLAPVVQNQHRHGRYGIFVIGPAAGRANGPEFALAVADQIESGSAAEAEIRVGIAIRVCFHKLAEWRGTDFCQLVWLLLFQTFPEKNCQKRQPALLCLSLSDYRFLSPCLFMLSCQGSVHGLRDYYSGLR